MTYVASNNQRPLGITILAVLVAIGVVLNLLSGLIYIVSVPLYGMYILLFVVLDIFVFIGLWQLKKWGWKLAIGVYALNIVGSFVVTNVFASTFINSSQLTASEADAFRSALNTGLILPTIIGIIIIIYVYSKRQFFNQ